MSLTATQSPSLANATGTLLDSACKHIQQCRVSYDHMLNFVENADELEKNSMLYCVHKDEVVVGVTRPWKKCKTRQLPPSAYPRVVSNLGNLSKEEEKYKVPRMMIKYLFHYATDIIERNNIINDMCSTPPKFKVGYDVGSEENHYFYDKSKRAFMDLSIHMSKMHDFYPVGISNTIGYAHPNSGDTMSSVMIGGLRTVMNGKWEVQAGDRIQWYFVVRDIVL